MLTGGFEILFELQDLERKDSCIIITQYSSIEINRVDYPIKKSQDALTNQFGVSVAGCLQYSESDDSWKSDLITLINNK